MKVVFLDRDGTIVKDPQDERVDSLAKVELFEDTLSSLKYLADRGFDAIFITNQASIAEGRLTEDEFWDLQNRILAMLKPSRIKILKTYMNGELPGPQASDWRKPGPKMLLQAARDFDIDISEVYMIGDRDSDVTAAVNAGCKGGIQVLTATHKKEISSEAVYVAPTLMDAVKFVVAN